MPKTWRPIEVNQIDDDKDLAKTWYDNVIGGSDNISSEIVDFTNLSTDAKIIIEGLKKPSTPTPISDYEKKVKKELNKKLKDLKDKLKSMEDKKTKKIKAEVWETDEVLDSYITDIKNDIKWCQDNSK